MSDNYVGSHIESTPLHKKLRPHRPSLCQCVSRKFNHGFLPDIFLAKIRRYFKPPKCMLVRFLCQQLHPAALQVSKWRFRCPTHRISHHCSRLCLLRSTAAGAGGGWGRDQSSLLHFRVPWRGGWGVS